MITVEVFAACVYAVLGTSLIAFCINDIRKDDNNDK